MKPVHWNLPIPDWTYLDRVVGKRNLVADSRKVQAGDVFLAAPGHETDGRTFIDAAVSAGAAAVLWEPDGFDWPAGLDIPNVAVPELAALTGIIAAHIQGNPGAKLWSVGVTGTNGKTSTAHWLAQAFNMLGNRTALVGTLGYGFLNALADASHTTPDAIRLQKMLRQFFDAGATHLAMEVSSHALEQGRAHGVEFDVALFTNLTLDHLDYHGTMAAYGAAKAKLFDWDGLQAGIINADDAFGSALLQQKSRAQLIGYGIENGEIRAEVVALDMSGITLNVHTPWGKGRIESKLVGRFNVYNLLGCLGVLLHSGYSIDESCAVLSQIESAIGRMDRMGGGRQPLVIIDYAHTPDALEKALSTLRETLSGDQRLICVFGCGGDRDRSKRPVMGCIACNYADTAIVTSDNPRTESPQAIIDEIVAGIDPAACRAAYHLESDRSRAIATAIASARACDVVLIAGKGHEEYQDIAGVKRPFSDRSEAANALEIWKASK